MQSRKDKWTFSGCSTRFPSAPILFLLFEFVTLSGNENAASLKSSTHAFSVDKKESVHEITVGSRPVMFDGQFPLEESMKGERRTPSLLKNRPVLP